MASFHLDRGIYSSVQDWPQGHVLVSVSGPYPPLGNTTEKRQNQKKTTPLNIYQHILHIFSVGIRGPLSFVAQSPARSWQSLAG